MLLVDVVLVNWNAGTLLADCVQSVIRHGAALVDRIVVVDNASTDGSLTGLAAVDSRITLIRNEVNRGFAAACNQGARGSRTPYVLFLNPDSRLSSDSLAESLRHLAAAPAEIAICGIRMVNDAGASEPSSRRFPTLGTIFTDVTRLSAIAPALFPPALLPVPTDPAPVDVDQVIGAFFLIRRRVFEELGGFDERFFVYYEEVDLSLRARQRGYRSVYLPHVAMQHHGGYSSGQVRGRRLFFSLRSRWLFARKHWTASSVFGLAIVTYGIELPARLLISVVRGRFSDVAATFNGYWTLTKWFLAGSRPLP